MRKLAYSDWKISIKLSIMYMCFLVFSLSISLTIYAYISNQITIEKQVSLITQSLNSLETNIDNVITNVSNNSRIIIANNEIQQVIKEKSNTELVANQNRVSTALVEMVHSIPYVQSIYVFDHYGHRYGSDKHSLKSLKFTYIEEASWYERAKDEKGYYIIAIKTIIQEKNKTTIVLRAVATLESVCLMPHLAKIAVSPANKAEPNAKIIHICSSSLQIILLTYVISIQL